MSSVHCTVACALCTEALIDHRTLDCLLLLTLMIITRMSVGVAALHNDDRGNMSNIVFQFVLLTTSPNYPQIISTSPHHRPIIPTPSIILSLSFPTTATTRSYIETHQKYSGHKHTSNGTRVIMNKFSRDTSLSSLYQSLCGVNRGEISAMRTYTNSRMVTSSMPFVFVLS